jgi:hypothetical protein
MFKRRRAASTYAAATETDPGGILVVRGCESPGAKGGGVRCRYRDPVLRAEPFLSMVYFRFCDHFFYQPPSSITDNAWPATLSWHKCLEKARDLAEIAGQSFDHPAIQEELRS